MKDIDFGKIIKRSWELTWKNKWLWVMGLVLAVFGGGSSYSSSTGNSTSSSTKIPIGSPAPTNLQEIQKQTSYVLGAATNTAIDWFKSIPAGYWAILIFGIIILVIFSIVVAWIITSWAKGALISGLNDADMGLPVNLKTVSPKGIKKIKDLIVFALISTGLSISIILGLVIIVGIGALVELASPILGMIWLILFGILAFLTFIVAMFLFGMLAIYAERLIVLKDYSPWQAWKKGLSLAKGNVLPTLVMGLIDGAIGCGVGCAGLLASLLVFAIPGFFLIYPMFNGGFHFPSIGQIIGIAVLIFLFAAINNLIRAVMVVFTYGNWNLLFKEILEKEENV